MQKATPVALVLSVAIAACGSASSSTTAAWTRGQQASYMKSCHKIALRHVKGLHVTDKQRDRYCARQLQLAQKYNPHHTHVHGFVGAYTATLSTSS